MRYTEVICTQLSGPPESYDLLLAGLAEIGYESFWESEGNLKAYIPENNFSTDKLNSCIETLSSVASFSIKISTLPDINWNKEWEQHFPPLVIDGRCSVRAPFHPAPATCEFDIIIEPKMSFGTGHHETTSLMISTVLQHNFSGKSVLDMGCGTGILAILAQKKGAAEIIAIDNDEWAYNNARENCQKNNCLNIKVIQGNEKAIPSTQYDIILANINRNIILEQITIYSHHLKTTGILICSGFYKTDLPEIKDKASRNNLQFKQLVEKNNWIATVFSKE